MYYAKLRWLLNEEEDGTNAELFEGWRIDEVEAVLTHLKSFYDERWNPLLPLFLSPSVELRPFRNILVWRILCLRYVSITVLFQ